MPTSVKEHARESQKVDNYLRRLLPNVLTVSKIVVVVEW
jgi:hypothetical protein